MCNAGTEGADPFATLMASIQGFVHGPAREMTQADVGEHLIALRHGIDLLELGFATAAAVFAETDEYEVQGSVSPVDWIRHHCHMSSSAAGRAVTSGEQYGRLLGSVGALDAGEIGFGHFALLASVARALGGRDVVSALGDDAIADTTDSAVPMSADPNSPGDLGDPTEATDPTDPTAPTGPIPFDERPLLDMAREHSVGRFGMDCTHARHAYDAAAVLREHVDGAERNRCELINCEGGFVAIRGFFDPVAGATLTTAILPFAKPHGARDTRTRERRLADALVELASHALDVGAVPGSGGTRTHLQLTASLETLQGLAGSPGGVLEHAGAVPAATVQRLACDARIRRIVLGPTSAVIEVGRALRLPSVAARAALRVRSTGCEWPRCDRTVAYTNAHHLVHWAKGGSTDLDNLVLLCYRHHWLIHEGGWHLTRIAEGGMLAIAPTLTFRTWTRAPVRV
jgi:Domain of unknown function (DUF222)/HNH endonuclease